MLRHAAAALPLIAVLAGLAAAQAAPNAKSYQFVYRPAQVGDKSTHESQLSLRIKATVTQAGRHIVTADQRVERKQRRTLTLIDSGDPNVVKGEVTFEVSEQTTSLGREESEAVRHPVAGKTYLVSRVGEELVITDRLGAKPPEDELEIVGQAMVAFGQRNPLAAFFAGRTVAVGQTLELPKQLAKEVFGLGNTVNEVARFRMQLVGTQTVGERTCGVFDTHIEATSTLDASMNLQFGGRLHIEIDTCRPVFADLTGPVTIYQEKGAKETGYTLSGKGQLHVTMTARHTNAVR